MLSEIRKYRRDLIIYNIVNELLDMLKRDSSMEFVSIWIEFKEKGIDVPINYQKVVSTFSDIYALKKTIWAAFEYLEIEHKKDKSLNLLNIILKTKISTNKQGAIFKFKITHNN
tara:strand:- start:90827 stop:91168 length:342 start_codon:yes stop_codon:yes gene_type:complete